MLRLLTFGLAGSVRGVLTEFRDSSCVSHTLCRSVCMPLLFAQHLVRRRERFHSGRGHSAASDSSIATCCIASPKMHARQ